ncbi:MAG: hypothetical protein U0R19_05440 [Bryobacteraceae bacterium]
MSDITELKRRRLSIQAISELMGFDRKTVRKYLLKPETSPVYGPRAKPRELDSLKPYLEERLKAGVWNACVLMRELVRARLQGRLYDPHRLAAAATASRGYNPAV